MRRASIMVTRALGVGAACVALLVALPVSAQPESEPDPVEAPPSGEASDTEPAEPTEDEDEGPLLLDDDIEELVDPNERVDPETATVRDVVVDDDDLAIPEVVVSGARVEQLADRVAVSTEVIRRQEIEESGARDAAELLEERSGLQVQRSFRGTELWLRGMDPEYTLVLVDGDRVPGRVGGAIDLSRYGVENLERVEIVRGPSSALYGSDAIGGVVNLITRDSNRDFEADALASYGMNHVVDATARVAGRPTEWLRLRLLGGLHYAAAFRTDEGEESTAGSERIQWSAGGRVDVEPDDHHRLRAQAEYVQLTLNGVDGGAGGATFDRTQLQEQMRASFEHTLRGPNGLRLVTRLTYNQFREQYLLDQRGSEQLDRYEDNREHMGQLTSLVHFTANALGHHGITVGFEQLFQSLDSERLVSIGRRTRLGLFAQDEWIPWEEGDASLTIVPGVRFDADSQFGEQVSPKLAVRFDPVEQMVIRASYGRGFRAPSFQQLLLRFENPTVGYVVNGNPGLGAESAHGVDAGVEWQPVAALRLSASFFRNDIENMIAAVSGDSPNGGGTAFGYENLANAWTMGLESTASLRVDDVLGVVAGYTLTSTWDGENERQLEGRALHRVTLATRLAYEPWEIAFVARSALMMDRVFYRDLDGDGVSEEVYADPLAQVDLRLSKRFDRYLELFVGVDNLLSAGDAYSLLRPFTFYGGLRGRY
ncbi:MAG: TonB-dependent receptor plug domain-containing protein [Sandaracinaceae bacterium]